MPGFKDCVQEASSKPVPPNKNPLSTLHVRLARTAKSLRKWSRSLISQAKLASWICREVINQLERAQKSEIGLMGKGI
jgi:hypothetical protein